MRYVMTLFAAALWSTDGLSVGADHGTEIEIA
jgi:hypothetical protein